MSGEAYFLYHSIGQYPGKARDLAGAMAEFAVSWGTDNDLQWAFALPRRQRFIDLWTRLIGAGPGSVTTTENVTHAFQAILTSLPAVHLAGKSLLVAADCFPSNHFLLQGLAERLGFTLKTVPFRQGASIVEEEDFLDAWTPDVGLALLTWVSSTQSTGWARAWRIVKTRSRVSPAASKRGMVLRLTATRTSSRLGRLPPAPLTAARMAFRSTRAAALDCSEIEPGPAAIE